MHKIADWRIKKIRIRRITKLQTSAAKESHKTNFLGVIEFRNIFDFVKSVLTITCNSLQWLVIKRNLANTCLLECNRFLFFSIKDWKISITIEMHWILSVASILDVITTLSTCDAQGRCCASLKKDICRLCLANKTIRKLWKV